MKKQLLDKVKEDFNDASLNDYDIVACVKLAQREYQTAKNAIEKYKEEKDSLNITNTANKIVTGEEIREAMKEEYRPLINNMDQNNIKENKKIQDEKDEPTR